MQDQNPNKTETNQENIIKPIATKKTSKLKLVAIVFCTFLATFFVMLLAVQYGTIYIDQQPTTPRYGQAPSMEYIWSLDTYNEEMKECGLKVDVPKAYSLYSNTDYFEFPKYKPLDGSPRYVGGSIQYGRFGYENDIVRIYCTNSNSTFKRDLLTINEYFESKEGRIQIDIEKADFCKTLSMDQESCDKVKDYKFYNFQNFRKNPSFSFAGLDFGARKYNKEIYVFTDGEITYTIFREYEFDSDILYYPKLELK